MGTLYLVSMPVGNVDDMTLRAVRILQEVDLIAAENTHSASHLLAHFEIEKPIISYYEHDKPANLDVILATLETGDVALLPESGTPGLTSPSHALIRAAIEHGAPVIPLPGASALLPVLVASGHPVNPFVYLGYPPSDPHARQAALEKLSEIPHTLVFYVMSHFLPETLADLYKILGARRVAIAFGLSEPDERIWRGTLDEARTTIKQNVPRGRVIVTVEGDSQESAVRWTEEQVRLALIKRLASGESRSTAARAVAELSGWPRRRVYSLDVSE